MSEPLVSVKMITYNHAPYIARAIEGVLQQKTTFPFELVIGEDFSTDGTREIVFDYQKKYPEIIRVITSDKNVGAAKNGYRTGKACRGKYLAFCEGDDYWHRSEKLGLQVGYLENHPNCGMVYSDYDRYYVGSGKLINSYNRHIGKKPPHSPKLINILRGQCGILTCTVCTRKDMARQAVESDLVLFSSGRFRMGDTQLWAEISCRADIFYFDESLATYNILEESATHSKDHVKKCMFWRSNSEMRVYLAKKHKLPEDEIRAYENDLHEWELMLAFHQNDKNLAESAKKAIGVMTFRQTLFFWGAKNAFFNLLIKTMWQGYHSVKRLTGSEAV